MGSQSSNEDITKSCGPDELHSRMLKELAVELAAPMTKLFNQSLFLGEIPEELKMANVSPRRGVERWQRTTVLSLSPQLVARLWRPLSDNPHTFEKEQYVIDKTLRISWRMVNHSATTNIFRCYIGA